MELILNVKRTADPLPRPRERADNVAKRSWIDIWGLALLGFGGVLTVVWIGGLIFAAIYLRQLI